jgi:hypothetical protein
MNLFKSLLFLERETTERRLPDGEFAPHYGNRLATEHVFAPGSRAAMRRWPAARRRQLRPGRRKSIHQSEVLQREVVGSIKRAT